MKKIGLICLIVMGMLGGYWYFWDDIAVFDPMRVTHVDIDIDPLEYEKAVTYFAQYSAHQHRFLDDWWQGKSVTVRQGIRKRTCHDVRWRPSGTSTRKITTIDNIENVDIETEPLKVKGFSLKFQTPDGCLLRKNYKFKQAGDVSELFESNYVHSTLAQLGVISPHLGTSRLMISMDGVVSDFGLGFLEEPLDDDFLNRTLGTHDGHLWKVTARTHGTGTMQLSDTPGIYGIEDFKNGIKPIYDYKGKRKNYDSAEKILQETHANIANKNTLNAWYVHGFNTYQFLTIEAMNMVMGNLDSYWSQGNNYALYFAPETHFLTYIPLDFDKIFYGSWIGARSDMLFSMTEQDIYSMTDVYFENMPSLEESPKRPLIENALADPVWRDFYTRTVRTFVSLLDVKALERFSQPLCDMLLSEGLLLTGDECVLSDRAKDFIEKRHAYLTTYFAREVYTDL